MAKKKKPQEEVGWLVTRLTGTPAKYIGRVYASTEAEAIKRAIEEHSIPLEHAKRLIARRED